MTKLSKPTPKQLIVPLIMSGLAEGRVSGHSGSDQGFLRGRAAIKPAWSAARLTTDMSKSHNTALRLQLKWTQLMQQPAWDICAVSGDRALG